MTVKFCVYRHKAIADYLQSSGYSTTLEAFKSDASLVSTSEFLTRLLHVLAF